MVWFFSCFTIEHFTLNNLLFNWRFGAQVLILILPWLDGLQSNLDMHIALRAL